MNTSTLFNKIAKLKVFVIGDVMIDNYWFGYSDRTSPEAPVPIVTLQKKETRLGGAINVSLNCKALGAETYTLSVIGKDEEAKRLMQVANDNDLITTYIVQHKERRTTSKSRVISSDKHIVRIDDEETNNLPRKIEQQFISHCLKAIQIEKPDVIILQDYNKGVLTPAVIRNVIAHAKEVGAKIAVDPKRDNFFAYKGVDIFKPNLKEIKDGLGIENLKVNKTNLKDIHEQIKGKLNHGISFITLSEKGVFVQKDKNVQIHLFQKE
jgi:D-glycero-beta-D-manno-heptose-7-phosphate kinase